MRRQTPHIHLFLFSAFLPIGCSRAPDPSDIAVVPPVSGQRPVSATNIVITTARTDWHQWRGPDSNGISPDTNWNPVFPEDGPKELWKQKIGTGFSSISVASGRVFTMGNTGSEDVVYCFGLDDGKQIWTRNYPQALDPNSYEGGPNATPAVDGDAVYTLSKTGDLFCLEAASGKVIWSKNVSRELGLEIPEWGYSSSVLVQGNLAIVNVGTFGTAFNKNTGALVWKTGRDASGYATPVPFKLGATPALAIFAAGYIVGIKEADGSLLWRHPWKTDYGVNAADPIISGNTVFVSSGYGTGCALIQFAPGKPQVLWQNNALQNHINGCVLIEDHIYGIDGMAERTSPPLKCIELKTGQTKWEHKITGTGSLIASGDKLIVLSGKGELLICEANPARFKEISSAQVIGGKCWTAPTLSNGRIIVRNAQGTLVCLDVRK